MASYEPPTALPCAFLGRPDVQDAAATHDFGTLFRLARSDAKISYSKIAAECDIKPERVGALARGIGSITTYEKIAKIADALRIPGHMLGLTSREWEFDASGPRVPALIIGEISEGGAAVQRRKFVKAAVGAGLVVGLPEIQTLKVGTQIGAKVPDDLRMRTARLRRLDDVLGGADTFRVYLGEYQATKALARQGSYTESTGRALKSVLAEQAQQAGWAAFDAGKHAEATSLYKESHAIAAEAKDASLAGNALAFLAYQQVNGDRKSMIETAVQSCRTAGGEAPSGVRALLHERLAWAYAVAGSAAEAERALSAAEAALGEGGEGRAPQPDWAAWVDHTELQIMIGRCWTELRRPLRAVPVLERSLSQYDDAHARDKSLYLSWLAESYLFASEIEQAAHTTARAIKLASGVASVRPQRRIGSMLSQLKAYRAVPEVSEVFELAKA